MPIQNNEIEVQFIASILIALLLIGSVVTFFLSYQKKKLKQEKEVADIKAAFENELLQTQLEIQEETMKNISMEIHDNIGQIMLLANVNISILQTMSLTDEASPILTETKKLLSKASEDISHLARSLHSDRITELGVFQAIKTELYQLAEKKIFLVQILDPQETDGRVLPKETQLLVFRMYQEICKNIIKHAGATTLTMRITSDSQGIQCCFADDGTGFEMATQTDQSPASNGVGLRSLQSRAKMFKGSIRIDTSPDQGTNVCIFIPSNSNS